jgi:hypothetical protein
LAIQVQRLLAIAQAAEDQAEADQAVEHDHDDDDIVTLSA